MTTPLHTTLQVALVAALAAAPAAHSQMYRWIDAHGSVTFSNQLPSDTRAVKDLTVVLENADKRANDLARIDVQPGGAAGAAPQAEPPQSSPRIAVSPTAPEAVRDPCLRSSDPKCIERNKAAYVPGRGYSPAAVGATSSTGAGGTLAGGSPTPPARVEPPKASAYALPPGNELKPLPLAGASLPRR
jgi:hypothetical protein